MTKKLTYLLTSLFLLMGGILSAQNSCAYTLDMFDTFGDGWNGAFLTVTVNGASPTDYTVGPFDNDGEFNQVELFLTDGDVVTIGFTGSFFDNEILYSIVNADGNAIFSDGPFPVIGANVFSFTVACPTCTSVATSTVDIDRIRATYIDVSWIENNVNNSYFITLGAPGFDPAMGGTYYPNADGSERLNGLTENTAYEFYITTLCENNDTSSFVGPFPFATPYANDMGVIAISSPTSACRMGSEPITVTLFNFGGAPQSLVPFNYSVNGGPPAVTPPTDGFFTGVLATDSLYTYEFDLQYDFSIPGDYIIQAWTELMTDSVPSNDTFSILVTSIPVIEELPYQETFEEGTGGWRLGAESANGTWEYGTPTGFGGGFQGQRVWGTNLDGDYNNNELSFLYLPCVDFTSIAEDPTISFLLFFDSEACCDEGWLEASTDGGATYTKIGASGTGDFWYNDNFNQWWDGDGGFTGWVRAKNVLTGLAGQSDVIMRFVFSTDGSVIRPGMAVDDVVIKIPEPNDVAASSAAQVGSALCGTATQALSMVLTNDGLNTQTDVMVGYQVNGGAPVFETVSGTLAPGQDINYTFTTTFDATAAGTYVVTVFTALGTDTFGGNDTTSFSFTVGDRIDESPYQENFEANSGGWLSGGTSSTWAYGTPTDPLMGTGYEGQKAWVTNLAGTYNNNENSFLNLPCADFSSFAADPTISFLLYFNTEACCDEGWLEVSTDGGVTFSRVGASGTGDFWYNDDTNQWWDGTGNFNGWVRASNVLTGLAGEPDVRLRFAFSSDGSVVREGMGIDDVIIRAPEANDLGAFNASTTAGEDCGSATQAVEVFIRNTGLNAQTDIEVSYQVNGGSVVTEMLPSGTTLASGEEYNHIFATTFDSSAPDEYTIAVWTNLLDDGNTSNDTTFFTFFSARALPLEEDFEGNGTNLPDGWSVSQGFMEVFGPGAHFNPSTNLGGNTFAGNTPMVFQTPNVGPLQAGDVLYFDYRYTDWPEGATSVVLTANDILRVSISTDCGETFTQIYELTGDQHTPSVSYTEASVALGEFAGQAAIFRFEVIWGSGDNWFDIDNIFIPRCSGNIGLAAEIEDASSSETADGSVTISAEGGAEPFTFIWSDGANTATRDNLLPGDYEVMVTDRFGCSETLVVTVSVRTGIEEVRPNLVRRVSLAPNPSSTFTVLDATFSQSVNAQLQLLNTLGQPVWQGQQQAASINARWQIPLEGLPAGLYLVRLRADDQQMVYKLLVQ